MKMAFDVAISYIENNQHDDSIGVKRFHSKRTKSFPRQVLAANKALMAQSPSVWFNGGHAPGTTAVDLARSLSKKTSEIIKSPDRERLLS